MRSCPRTCSHRITTATVPLAAALFLVTLTGCSTVRSGPVASPSDAPPVAERQASPPMHQNPPLLRFENGVGKLNVGLSNVRIADRHYCMRTYNGSLTGPTILVPAQQSSRDRFLRLDVTNGLQRSCPGSVRSGAPNDLCRCTESEAQTCYDFNSTNLHTHGLHVRPDSIPGEPFLSDHVLMHLNYDSAMTMHGGAPLPRGACGPSPGGFQCRYKFAIDEGSQFVPNRNQHEPGTFWYHAHVHGSTAIQLANGMAGALIIRGPVDTEIPAIAAATDQIMVLQQIPYEQATAVPPQTRCDPTEPSHYSVNAFGTVRTAQRNLVNGRLEPIVAMRTGEVQRWRLIHAGITNEILLELEGPLPTGSCHKGESSERRLPLHEIAADGITMVKKRTSERLRLDPGYRSDVLVKVPAGALVNSEYCVVDARGRSLQNPEEFEERNLVAVIRVTERGREMDLPPDWQLASVAKQPLDCPSTPPPPIRETIFNQQGCDPLNIDCKHFPDVNFDLKLNDVETWKLTSGGGPHPYHIHVNPFTVCEEGGVRLEQPYWRDTLLLEGGKDYQIRSRYLGFTGKFVLHCHRLDHEDLGMMGLVEIKE